MLGCEGSAMAVAGAKIAISRSCPLSQTLEAFQAISDWKDITKISNFGTIGDTWQTATYTEIDKAREYHVKTFKSADALDLSYTFSSTTDEGKEVLKEAFNSPNDFPFRITLPNGVTYYFLAKVLGNATELGDGSAVISVNASVQPNSDIFVGDAPSVETHTVTFAAGANGSIIGAATQTVADGGYTTAVYAAANNGYVFASWSDSNTTNPRTVTNVTGDMTLTASFTAE